MTNANVMPAVVQLGGGKLAVSITAYDVQTTAGSVPCWLYLSDGLRARRQREIAFLLRRRPGEAVEQSPHDPLRIFGATLALVEQGQSVDAGALTDLGQQPLLNNPEIRGLGHVRTHPCFGLSLPSDVLVAIALFGQELEVARAHGLTRVVTQLGFNAQQFPCPPWCDRDRPAVVSFHWTGQTMLSHAVILRVAGVTATLEANWVTLVVPAHSVAHLRAQVSQVPLGVPFALLCDVDPRADACLTWQPGQRGPVGISPNGSAGMRISGAFVLFVGDQPGHWVQIVEDGFAVMTTGPVHAIRQALMWAAPLQTPPAGQSPGLSIVWDANAAAPGPLGPGSPPAGELYMRWTCSMMDMTTRVAPGALDRYADAVESTLHQTIASLPAGSGQDLWMSVTLSPGDRLEVQLKSRPGLDQGTMQRIYDALLAVQRPPVLHGPVGFRGVMALWGGSGAPLDPG